MIAIVDDDTAARNALHTLLRSLGYNAFAFASPEELLRSGKLKETSCLITDLNMPSASGLDLQDRLIEMGHRVPIIFITGRPDSSVQSRAMRAGAVCFLSKPHDTAHLIECIEKALQGTRRSSARV